MRIFYGACIVASPLVLCSPANAQTPAWKIADVLDVAPVWPGHPVRFALLTHGNRQFVAFYAADRRMTVGSRDLDSDSWQFVTLPTSIGWDSHNYITMTVDDDRQIHLSGNMHCVPLIYFRTRKALDITTMEKIPAMIGTLEDRATYPRFLRGPNRELVFTYRDGSSGNGNQIFNVYDHASRTWRRLLDEPLFSGEGKMNAYFVGPVQDASGMGVQTASDLGSSGSSDIRYLLRWETLPRNRDRPHPGDPPHPSLLKLYKLAAE